MNYLLLTIAIALTAQFATLACVTQSFDHFHSLLKQEPQSKKEILIEEIEIRGNRRIPRDKILAVIKSRPGDPYNAEQARRDLEAIFSLGVFDPLGTKMLEETGPRGGRIIVFTVKEYPLIRDLRFEGLRSVSEDELVARLKERKVELVRESPLTSEKISVAKKIIGELLAEKGRTRATITVWVEEISAVTVAVIFRIEE
jgi:outer membrane protein insertion porin family